MSPDELEHLFEPFTHDQTNGNGLGLWVTYRIVEQLNGDIAVSSEPGETQFTARFPLIG